MRVQANRAVPIWVFARIEEQANYFQVPELRCERERFVALMTIRRWEQMVRVFDSPQSCCDWQGDMSATSKQSVRSVEFAMRQRGLHCRIGVRFVIAE